MTEKNPATEQATTVEDQSVTAHSVSEKAVFETEKSGASTSDKRAAIKQALRPQLRRTSVVEDYAAELDEMASLTHALSGCKKDGVYCRLFCCRFVHAVRNPFLPMPLPTRPLPSCC